MSDSVVETRKSDKIFMRFKIAGRRILIPLLQAIQEEYGYLPDTVLKEASSHFKIPLSKIYGVATFYAQFYLKPRGKHTIKCCRGTACHIRGASAIIQEVEKILGIKDGKTTKDMLFSLETVACLGACALAPVVVLDGKYYGKMNREKIKRLLGRYLEHKDKENEEVQRS